MMEWRQRTRQKYNPIPCDVDLYFRIHKLHHSGTYPSADTQKFMLHTPLLFGLWHADNYCLIMCFRQFLTFCTVLEHKMFLDNPTSITICTNFNVGMVEQMVLSAFLASGRVTPHIRGELATLARPDAVYAAIAAERECLRDLHHLFKYYIPALFYLGY